MKIARIILPGLALRLILIYRARGSCRTGSTCLTSVALLAITTVSFGLSSQSNAIASQQSCGNEPLRAEIAEASLPNCRAYEMVTPLFKEGYSMFVEGYSADGNQAVLASLGTVAGNEGSGEIGIAPSLYLATRSTAGWKLAPLNPPISEFIGQIPIAIEADHGNTLWLQHTPAQSAFTVGLYARSDTGNFRYLGELNPNAAAEGKEPSDVMFTGIGSSDKPVATTSDYSHVVLAANSPGLYWPFDNTLGTVGSIYEYSGTNHTSPILVGVTGEKGSTALIGRCGTYLGSEKSAYNAMSRDGETVFFTVVQAKDHGCSATAPPTAEIYARIHGALTSPMPAETVNISASECTGTCGLPSGKNFEGASEDGSLAYFTSTQQLTDNAVDGTASGSATREEGCAESRPEKGGCNLYLYEIGTPAANHLRLVAGGEVLGVSGIAENGERVYFVSRTVIPGAGLNPFGRSPQAGQPNLYVYDSSSRGTALVATLGGGDERAWLRQFRRTAEVAGDGGRFLLFASSSPGITPDDEAQTTQLFEYKAPGNGEAAELVRVTKGEDGYNSDGNAVSVGVEPASIATVAERLGNGKDFKSASNRLNISTTGETIAFETAGELSPRAVSARHGCQSIYEFHADSSDIKAGKVSLISDGRDTELYHGVLCGSQLQAMDATGENVLFFTEDPLLASDMDGLQGDVYDAREGGGFVEPPATQQCSSSSCGAISSPVPTWPTAGSSGGREETPVNSEPSRGVKKSKKHIGRRHKAKRHKGRKSTVRASVTKTTRIDERQAKR